MAASSTDKITSGKTSVIRCYEKNFLTCLLCAAVVLQGGFFPSCVLAIGILTAVVCLFVKIRPNTVLIFMLLFCVWYSFCTLKNGFVLERAAAAALPFTIALYYAAAVSLDKDDRNTALNVIVKISVFIAAAAIIQCAAASASAGKIQRLLFPFQYSNACGIYFVLIIIISDNINDKFVHKTKWIFYAALALTQSVGSVIVFAAWMLTRTGRMKQKFILTLCIFILCLIWHNRIYESIGTFIERLLQIRDGFSCAAANPIFGIGGGQWNEARNYYQSGFYDAVLIHSGIAQIAADSGFLGLALFLIPCLLMFLKCEPGSKSVFIIFLIHSCFDISLSFLGLDLLIILSAANTGPQPSRAAKAAERSVLAAALAAMLFLEIGFFNVRQIKDLCDVGKYSEAVSLFEDKSLARHSTEAQLSYVLALCENGDVEEALEALRQSEISLSDKAAIKSALGDKTALMDALKTQPYNGKIYSEIENTGNTEQKHEAEKIKSTAINSMSHLGEILYTRTEGTK